MLENNRKLDVELDASIKSCGERNGSPVSSDNAATASSENASSAQIEVPIAVPPRFISYIWSTFRSRNVKSASSVAANE